MDGGNCGVMRALVVREETEGMRLPGMIPAIGACRHSAHERAGDTKSVRKRSDHGYNSGFAAAKPLRQALAERDVVSLSGAY